MQQHSNQMLKVISRSARYPLRWLATSIRFVAGIVPLSPKTKGQVLSVFFRKARFLVGWTTTFKDWKAEQDRIATRRLELEHEALLKGGTERYVEPSALLRPDRVLARAIAFYLPQFHPIPENDRWWGEGFTEWRNVTSGAALFEGHNQPKKPGELGYYDLLAQPWIRQRQADLAHQYGLDGFCFYFYWFQGKRLLEAPVEAYADDESISFPFCLCWANEPWSRRWDGRDDDVLMAQAHSAKDDIRFIEYLSRYLRNSKYIRVNGRPIVIVYRPGMLPEPKATVGRWRTWCRDNGIGEIYVVYTQSFDTVDPAEYGMDAAIEFPPNNSGLAAKSDLVRPISPAQSEARFYDWSDMAKRFEAAPSPRYKLHRGVTPQWDNTSRRGQSGTVFVGETASAYSIWLAQAVSETVASEPDAQQRLVFINAWNEWAEGAYLEPDERHGYKWLEATRDALRDPREDWPIEPRDLVPLELPPLLVGKKRRMLLVVHDLHKHGAQFLSLNFAKCLSQDFGYEVVILACGDGQLRERFEVYGQVLDAPRDLNGTNRLRKLLGDLKQNEFNKAIVNSSASGWIVTMLSEAGIDSVGLVHELPHVVQEMDLGDNLRAMNEVCLSVIFASTLVEQQTAKAVLEHDWVRSTILPQGLYKPNSIVELSEKDRAQRRVQSEFGLAGETRLILGVGYGDRRKGIDTFIQWAIYSIRKDRSLHFFWLGKISPEMQEVCDELIAEAGELSENIHLVGFREDTDVFYRAANAYALTSREDPFPSTPIEAMAAGAPVFMIADSGGLTDLATSDAVQVLPDDQPSSFFRALERLLSSPVELERRALLAVKLVQSRFGFTSYVGDVLRLLNEPIPKISVVVPNYNYARFLPQRLSTITNQALPIWELIILDDASSDQSVEVICETLRNCKINYRIVLAEENSGSVFAQWKRGVDLAAGEIVWIAEADDWAANDFTAVAAPAFEDEGVVLSYTQSHQVDTSGDILSADYLDYVADIDAERWRRAYCIEGKEDIARSLSVRNTIPNVSGVLFRKDELRQVLQDRFDEVNGYRVAGDWCVYIHLLMTGKISFDPRPLNYHRRHEKSVTISKFSSADLDEIKRMQKRVAELSDVSLELRRLADEYISHLAARVND